MGGGLMQLVAYGAQDVYLTGNPQITFFKVVYRRHTNFSIEMDELPIDTARPGSTFTVQILRNGDLATRMYLRLQTPKLTSSMLSYNADPVLNGKVAWVRRLGHAAIRSWKIQIGGTDIDTQYGVWLDLWYELTHTTMQERGYENMIGDVPEMTTLAAATSVSTDTVVEQRTLYIPLQFWFNRNPGLALPLIALQYHDVRLQVELEELSKLLVWSGAASPNLSNLQYTQSGLMVDYVYLDSEERRRFAQVGHEYLIEQVQTLGNETLTSYGAAANQSWKLSFNHPCKELVWALKCGAYNGNGLTTSVGGRGSFLCYTSDPSQWDAAVDYAAANLAFNCFTVKASLVASTWTGGAAAPTGSVAFSIPIVGAAVAGVPGVTNELLSFPLPSGGGSVYASVTWINTSGFNVTAAVSNAVWFNTRPLLSGVYNLLEALGRGAKGGPNALITMSITISGNTTDAVLAVSSGLVVSGHNLSLRDVSIPVEDFVDTRVGSASGTRNPWDVRVVQPSNYGLRLDGAGNPVGSVLVKLNGHDRFDLREGSYFNYVQPFQHHTRTPADGVNVYSFGLHPEQHQPSGTANLSRIDTTELKLVFTDPFRSNKLVPALDYARDSAFNVFAVNYNVLRCMSGMAGLAYSN
jgi:hypothetical protein